LPITVVRVRYVLIANKKMTDMVCQCIHSTTKVLNLCTKCLNTFEDITTVSHDLPPADEV